jgi:hypothetical protein
LPKPAPASVYPYLYEFIARYKDYNKTHQVKPTAPGEKCAAPKSLDDSQINEFTNPMPKYMQQVGYGPMQSRPFEDISAMGLQ